MKFNLIFLPVLTLALAVQASAASAKYDPKSVLAKLGSDGVACFRNENPYDSAHFKKKNNQGKYKYAKQRVKGMIAKFKIIETPDYTFGEVDLFMKLLGKGDRVYNFSIGCDKDFKRCQIECDGPSISVEPKHNRLVVRTDGIPASPTGNLGLCGDPSLVASVAAELGYITQEQAESIYDVEELMALLGPSKAEKDQQIATIKRVIREYATVGLSGEKGADDIFYLQPMKSSSGTCSWKNHPHNPKRSVKVPFPVVYPENQDRYDDLFPEGNEDNAE